MSATFDLVHWEPVVGGLRVSAGARNLRYPAVIDVRRGIVYGYDASLTGTLLPNGEPPATPVLTAQDLGDGAHALFTLSGAEEGTTNTLYTRLLASSIWTPVGTFANAEDGAATLRIELTKGSYWAYAVSNSATGRSATQPVSLALTNTNEAHYAEMRRALRERILSSATLAGLLSTPEAVYLDRAPESAGAPRIVFTEGRGQNTDGGRELYYTLTIWAATRGVLDSLSELVHEAVTGSGGFDTAGWSVREVTYTGQVVRVPEEAGGAGRLYAAELSFTLFAYETGNWPTLTLADQSVTLPPLTGTLELLDRRHQAAARSMSNAVFVYDRGAGEPVATLRFRAVSQTERETLRSFFNTAACGMQNRFTLTGVEGGSWLARFAEAQLRWTQKAVGAYALEFSLELQE